MNGKVTVDQLAQVIRTVDGRHSLGAAALAEAILEALPHLQPAKPEAVRLRDELRERAEFEAWAEGRYKLDKQVNAVSDLVYVDGWVQAAFVGWQAALAATGKQTALVWTTEMLERTEREGAELHAAIFGRKEERDDATGKQQVPNSVIRDVFLRNGFTIKDGQDDLKPYVYAAARELIGVTATGKQQVGVFPWENLPAYLIDKCEGDTISEEGIQRAVADMAKDARYCMPQQVGEVQG